MAIKALFPSGKDTITVSGLHQWDYGRTLEIEIAELGDEIAEVHFSHPGLAEAIVRPCTFAMGVGNVTIPDSCLEQSNTITAWVYRIDGTLGYTYKTISLPIISRTRPSATHEIAVEFYDKYTELITEVNKAVENLNGGNVAVNRALYADNANYATNAGNAASATYATSAGYTETATKASQDKEGNVIHDTYAKKNDLTNGNITVKKATSAGSATSAGTINKYMHNVNITVDMYPDNPDNYASVYVSFITNSSSAITDSNVESQISGYIRELAGPCVSCTGYYDYNGKSYNLWGLKYSGNGGFILYGRTTEGTHLQEGEGACNISKMHFVDILTIKL